MKIKLFLLTGITALIALTGCSKKESGDTNSPDPSSTKKVFLQLDALRSRATENTAQETKPDLLSALIYFIGQESDPVVYDVRAVGPDAETAMADLKKGVEFQGVPRDANQVYVVGNYNSSDASFNAANFPGKGARLSQIEATVLNIEQVNYPVLKNGSTNQKLLTVLTGEGELKRYQGNESGWGSTEMTPGNEDYYANISLKPINARIEVVKMQYEGILSTFTLEGIYINKFETESTVTLDYLQDKMIDCGSNVQRYDKNDDQNFSYKNYSTMYETIGTPVSVVNNTATMNPDQGFVWAFQVFGDQPYVSHLIIKLTDVKNENNQPIVDKFLTVKGLINQDNNQPLTTLEPGKNYKIQNLVFKDDDLEVIPEPELISVWVMVTVEDWVTVNVTPEI